MKLDSGVMTEASRVTSYRRLVERLPVTLRPAINQQLNHWELLFPFERNQLANFMNGVASYSPSDLDALLAPLHQLENKMGVNDWNFSENSDTIENASQLARSAHYVEWRRDVQKIYETFSSAAQQSTPPQPAPARLLLLVLPSNLPVDPLTVWKQWVPHGYEIKISGDAERLCELALNGGPNAPSLAAQLARHGSTDDSDLWLIDAEAKLRNSISAPVAASALSYAALKPFRDNFLADLNKAPKNIRITDEVMASLRIASWDGLWPAEVAARPRMRKFVIDLFLSGNGALIFPSPFVEWAASEAIRRARPRVVVARFGMRSKPKPFTSIAVFENQQRVSSLPDVDDPENSAIDAMILARYIWLAAQRYPECEQTLCLCISESAKSAYLIQPPAQNQSWRPDRTVTAEELYRQISAQQA